MLVYTLDEVLFFGGSAVVVLLVVVGACVSWVIRTIMGVE